VKHRLATVPPLSVRPAQAQAAVYNRVRIALARLGSPLRWRHPTLRGLDIYLDAEAWICGDRTLHDLPVLAWTEFQASGRLALHEPVACRLSTYHEHANIIIAPVLEEIGRSLAERLVPGPPADASP